MPSPSLSQVLRGLFLVLLTGSLLYFVVLSRHWPMLVDSPVMHYVTFLTEHGFRPYRDITDNNMPGAYLLERFAISVFGGSDFGWRLYEFSLLACLIGAMAVISAPRSWFAGVFAAGLFALRHASEGAWFAVEREEEMTVLLAVACALLFVAVRRQRPLLAFGFGFLAGFAASIKPTLVPFCLVSLVVVAVALKRRQISPMWYLASSCAGLLTVLAIVVAYLMHYRALLAFFFVLRKITPVYVSLDHPSRGFLLQHVFPYELLPLLALSVAAATVCRFWDWEATILLLASLNGLLSYFVQGKGFFHHRYIFVAFTLLLASFVLFGRPYGRRTRTQQILACSALTFAIVYVDPKYTRALNFLPTSSPLTLSMEADLRGLEHSRPPGEVQCFDLTYGCLNSLYHLGLIENTGFTGDLLLFPVQPTSASEYYRQLFWQTQRQHPARVLVFTNQEFGAGNSFDRLRRWPELERYLAENYMVVTERQFPFEDRYLGQAPASQDTAPAYRIYLRKDRSVSKPP